MQFSQLELANPYWLWILPLPIIIYWLIPAYRTRQSAIKVPFFDVLVQALDETPSEGASELTASVWQKAFLVISWSLLILALTKPTILGEPQTRERLGRDVMVVVDLSGSMAEPDFVSKHASGKESDVGEIKKISRLEATKEVLADFVKTRKGDRLGLILFGDAAFVQTPFTADQKVWLELLNQTDVAMAGQSTHLGDAIGLAIKVFEDSSSENKAPKEHSGDENSKNKKREKVAIVLTDGNDTGSYVEPIDAAKVAAAKDVRIHMIAMGDPRTVGEQALDMDVINRVAEASGGKAFQAINRDELEQAYEAIGELEPQLYESTTYRPKESVHQYPVMLIVAMYLLAFGFATIKRHLKSSTVKSTKQSTNQSGERNV
ncbi:MULTISPECIES: VWA domain-containing protein [unclassified Aliivibrio]|jgi:Ca-activated chloride channel family protein|uniref:VWA domain-containing protein n=1 Tax=unclassified Aliivibrio TaxID=2645654 RepID=UPI00080E35B4|nr:MULTISPECIES: VWA domain-containing protein [unclassified Aliivibrio]OCH18996.1 aerotolerance regulator BatA [Aliivibrio sp. 1S165]OCH19873.1 aerotolerance regulator BatA [Aliivibrio sp. 1S128]OCH30809.1 aerotolerance regulator BatA [Aliivibrio sp. 1S175]